MSDFRERICDFASKKSGSIRAFEIECGLTIGIIQKAGDGINTTNLTKVVKRYPDLDLYWLLTGEQSATTVREITPHEEADKALLLQTRMLEDQCNFQRGIIDSLQRTIDALIAQKGASISQSISK